MAAHDRWTKQPVGRDEWGVYALLGCAGVVVTLLALWWTVKRGEA